MAQISLRLTDEQEQRLRHSAQTCNMQFTVYLRQLLELGEQVQDTLPTQQKRPKCNNLSSTDSIEISKAFSRISENLYLMRYLVGKLFKEEAGTAKQIAHKQAVKDLKDLVGETL